ncbi:hypothetical protein K7432_005731 [Basidiobolus ranarum]|uniref:Cytochrome c oxidase subunit 8, mitochondrial n=1 Tax=Basidiobolus ranarum TaxID=34480 RepID=A0ABR2WW07_9FUNG
MNTVFARSAIRSRSTILGNLRRSDYHFENIKGDNMPFSYKNRRVFAVKMTAFCGLGFALPFVASYWQLSKSQ